VPEFDFLIGSRLFELYLALQKFYAIGKEFTTPTSGKSIGYYLDVTRLKKEFLER